jgi:hypothetical protein
MPLLTELDIGLGLGSTKMPHLRRSDLRQPLPMQKLVDKPFPPVQSQFHET